MNKTLGTVASARTLYRTRARIAAMSQRTKAKILAGILDSRMTPDHIVLAVEAFEEKARNLRTEEYLGLA